MATYKELGMSLPPRRAEGQVPVPWAPPKQLTPNQAIPPSLIPQMKQAWISGWSEPPNLSSSATVQTIQMAIRSAEGGNTRQLFALYRDLLAGGSHIQTELGKRKMAVLSQPHSIMPPDKNDKDDLKAAQAIRQMIDDCGNWINALGHFLDSVLYPVSVSEKIFKPAPRARGSQVQLRYTLKEISDVNYQLLCFKLPYLAPSFVVPNSLVRPDTAPEGLRQIPATLTYYPDAWEPDLRFYNTFENGFIDLSWATIYPPDPLRHIVHRNHLLTGVRDNFGGPFRSIIFLRLLQAIGMDGFARFMERYGSPFIMANTDTEDPAKVNFLQQQFAVATKLFGLVVDRDTQVQLKEAASGNTADAHDTYLNILNKEISKLILGQTSSSNTEAMGLGGGAAKDQSDVRQDLRMFDQKTLNETLKRQLFGPFLEMNGLTGAVPNIVWGGLSETDGKLLGDTLLSFASAGLEPTDKAIETISERSGIEFQRKAVPASTDEASLNAPQLKTFRAAHIPSVDDDAVNEIAARHTPALGAAIRENFAPAIKIIRDSKSPAEAEARLKAHFADWRPSQLVKAIEPALQECAASAHAPGDKKV